MAMVVATLLVSEPFLSALYASRPEASAPSLHRRSGTKPPSVRRRSSVSRYRGSSGPGWHALEDAVGALEGGSAVSFGSGMGAAAAILDLVPVGAHVVVPTDSYAGVRALLGDGTLIGR